MTKVLSTIFILFVCSISTLGQIGLKNKSIIDPNLKLLYPGVENLIVLHGSTNQENYSLISSSSEVVKINDTSFVLTPSFYSKIDTIDVFIDDVIVQSDYFIIGRVAISNVQLGLISKAEASRDEIIENAYLNLMSPDLYIEEEKLEKFNLNILDENGEIIYEFVTTYGKNLTTEQIEVVSKLELGSELVFTEIWIKYPSGMSRNISDFRMRIK